ncbi:AAA family ATPase [Nonomuraea sp. NPDC049480]|uniref:helix-turn-helix transcriptional regulator n=1 Tax=Nonomuraea sp. NPDC049480 TaxID=3364353 RepID=UPI0037B40E4F
MVDDVSLSQDTFIDRTTELESLGAHAAAARAGRPRLVHLTGSAGIGKTSLLRAFLAGDACRGMTTLDASCRPAQVGTAWSTVQELFRPVVPAADRAPASPLFRGAQHALPALLPGTPGEQPPAPTHPVLYALHVLAANLMADGPLVLVLDDVQWCDEQSLRWLDFLLRRASELPLLVVLAQRTETRLVASGTATEIAARHPVTTIALASFTATEVAEMVGRVLPGPVEPSFTRTVAAMSGGHPLVLTRLLRALRTAGVRPDEDEGRVVEIGRAVVAASVREVLGHLPDHVRDVARAVAVLGEESADLVGALARVPDVLTGSAVAVLRRAGLVARDRSDLVHDVVRSAVLQTIGAHGQANLRNTAAILLSDAGRPADKVAEQLIRMPYGTRPWMVSMLRDAACLAEREGAPAAAARYLRHLLEAEPGDVPVRVHLARLLVETDPSEATLLIKEGLTLTPDVRTRAEAAVEFAMACIAVDQSAAAVPVLIEVLDDLDLALGSGSADVDQELRTLAESALFLTGSAERSTMASLREHIDRIGNLSGHTLERHRLLAVTSLLTVTGDCSAEEAVEQARQALLLPEDTLAGWPQIVSALVLSFADEVEESLGAFDGVLRYAEEKGAVHTYALALSSRASVLYGLGMIPDAMADARLAVKIADTQPQGKSSRTTRITLAGLLIDRDEPEHAETLLAQIEPLALDRSVWGHPWFLMVQARARRALGDQDGALRLLTACAESIDETGSVNPVFLPWWADTACLLAEMDRRDEAGQVAERGTEVARRWRTARTLGLAALARGVSASGGASVDLLTESVEMLSRSPARGEHARAEHLLGRAFLAIGDQNAARRHLRAAADLARRCGALALAKAARRSLIDAGGRMPEITSSMVDILTRTERKIAGLATSGMSNQAIAQSLFVTIRTVEMHLTSVYRKLGVNGRAELRSVPWAQDGDLRVPEWVLASLGRR